MASAAVILQWCEAQTHGCTIILSHSASKNKPAPRLTVMVTFHYTQLHQRYPTHGRSCQQEFTTGKEAATISHVLTHTGGFPMITFPFLRYGW